MTMRVITILLLCTTAFAAGRLPSARPESAGVSSERLDRIRASVARYLDRQEIAGAVTLVARRGAIVHLEAHGFQDLESKKPMPVDAIFRIASMTKPVTSVAVMMLLEEGRFLLTDPVSKFLPEFKDPKVAVATRPGEGQTAHTTVPARGEITIQHLLTHTAGLASTTGPAAALAGQLAAERRPDWTIGDYVSRLAKLPLNFHPGAAWEYGPATDVLGRLVEVVSGLTLDRFFAERIFAPLGMEDTFFYVPDEKLARLATNYVPAQPSGVKPAARTRGSQRYFSGGGGLSSTAEDYYLFSQMVLNGGVLNGKRLLSRKSVELMTANHIGDHALWPTLAGHRFGLGFSIIADPGKAARLASPGTYGWGGAFGTYFWIDPKEQLIGIYMKQLRPYSHLNTRVEFQNVVTQAIVD
jgi:CubicO group peptidase (beta-lactamase class C family)